MKTQNLFRYTTLLCILSMALSACSAAAAKPNAQTQVAQAAVLTLQAMGSQTPTPAATHTPLPTATATDTPEPTLGPISVGPTNFPDNVDPLTGMPVSDTKILDRAPVMIKVSNYPATGRPHAGLSSADIVFDYFIGEGGNRFLALFYGNNADQVGPIRSARFVDAQLVPMYQGVLGYDSADAKVLNKILTTLGERAIMPSTANCPAICDNGDGTVISVFANTAKFSELAAKQGIPTTRPTLNGMAFDTNPPSGGKPADDILVQYNDLNRGEWRYDANSGKYKRWIESLDANNNVTMVELTDRNTNRQLAFSNVIMLFATYIQYAPTLHDVSLVGYSGKAIMYRDGQAYEGTWKAPSKDQPIQFAGSDGKTFALRPGNTWINIMADASSITNNGGKWTIFFNIQ